MRAALIPSDIRMDYAMTMESIGIAPGSGTRTCDIATVTVFIVDSSTIVRERLSVLLAELDSVEVIGNAHSAGIAISAIRADKPDLVIQDVHTADGSGIDLLRAIKQAACPPLVIVLTNDAYPAYRKVYLQAGADFFLDKSSEFDQIPEVLRRLLSEQTALGDGTKGE